MSDSAQQQMSGEQAAAQIEDKGKGKMSTEEPMEEDDSESSSEEEDQGNEIEEPDEDNMEEIEMDNIVGSRTRGKNIDFAEAAKNMPADEDDDDDDDDDDFQDDDDKMED